MTDTQLKYLLAFFGLFFLKWSSNIEINERIERRLKL